MSIEWRHTTPFTVNMVVCKEDIDELGHANNAAYVRWLERCAWQHSEALGLSLADYRRLDRAMVVLRHEIDYLAASYLGDGKLRLTRHFQICRLSDGATLLRAQSTFVCMALSSGKPKRMPPEFLSGYGQAIIRGQAVS